MFTDIRHESDKRIVEIRECIHFIASQTSTPPTEVPRYLNSAKGLIYVQLYGSIEYTLLKTISKSLHYINETKPKINQLKPTLLSLALSPQLDALIQVSTKKWDKRNEVFSRLQINDIVNMNTALLPTDGGNFTNKQLKSIWETFNISTPIFHDIRFRGRLQNIVTNRINIAHGNCTASDVGKIVTINDLHITLSDVSGFCTHVITTFEDYIESKQFLK